MAGHSEIKSVAPDTRAEIALAGTASPHYLAATHEVLNQPTELANYNLYASDTALREAVDPEGGGWTDAALHSFRARLGTPEYLKLGHLADKFQPHLTPPTPFVHPVHPRPFLPPHTPLF